MIVATAEYHKNLIFVQFSKGNMVFVAYFTEDAKSFLVYFMYIIIILSFIYTFRLTYGL